MPILWNAQVGDTGETLTAVLRELPTVGQRTGDPVDLSAVTAMTSKVVRLQDLAVVADDTATWAANGDVERDLNTNISAWPGLYGVTFTATFSDGTIRRFPTSGDHYFLRMQGTMAAGYVWTDPGGDGGAGGDDEVVAQYIHSQTVAGSVWTVVHDLGILTPNVTLIDGNGIEFQADIDFVDTTQLTVTIATPTTGAAYITI